MFETIYQVKIKFFKDAIGSKDQDLLGNSLAWLNSGHSHAFLTISLDSEICQHLLQRIIFDGVVTYENLAAWMFDELFGYELEEEGKWEEYLQRLLSHLILSILAQNVSFYEIYSPDEYRYGSTHRLLKDGSQLPIEIENLWKYIFYGRSIVGETHTEALGRFYHKYFYNSEITQILENFPVIDNELVTVQGKLSSIKNKRERQQHWVSQQHYINALYSYNVVKEEFADTLAKGLDWFAVD